MKGRIIAKKGPLLEVSTQEGRLLTCTARQRVLKEKGRLFVGDFVEVRPLNEKEGVIEALEERSNLLPQPPVANLDQVMLLFTWREPPLSCRELDALLVLSAHSEIPALVVFNKLDLLSAREREELARFARIYEELGYRVLTISALTGEGLSALRPLLRDRLTALAGPSGVGKSTLLNVLIPGARLRTAAVSPKTGRGRHTTVQTRLLALPEGGFVVDTPGFSRVRVAETVPSGELRNYFPEFLTKGLGCAFPDCRHTVEPDCGVREAVRKGRIARSRYESYRELLREIERYERARYG